MKERRRRLLEKAVLIEGALFIFSVIGTVICYMQCQRIKTEIQQTISEENFALGVQFELEQMEIEENIITNIVLGSSANEDKSWMCQVEYKNCGQALMNPYMFPVKGDDIFFSIDCRTEVKEGFDAEIGFKLYALEKMDYDSVRRAVEKPIASMESDYGILRLKEYLNNSQMLYLAEISYKGAQLYFSFELK